MKKNILYLLIGFTTILSVRSQGREPIKILFVGNSFTYFWNMPQLVAAMAEYEELPLEIHQSTVGGSNLEEHFDKKKGTLTQVMLMQQKWDYVILQDHSLSTIEAAGRFREYGGKMISLVRKQGAEPLLFMTWAYKSNPLMQSVIAKEYQNLGDSLTTKVIPVGDIFMQARTFRPDLDFYFDDKHPSSEGSYLIALVFYRALTGKSVLDIPERLLSKDNHDRPLILSFVSKSNADFFKQLVGQYKFEQKSIIKELKYQ